MKRRLFLICSLTAARVIGLDAAPLTEAHVTKIVNDVKLVAPNAHARAARLNDTVSGQTGVATGAKSRSELQFQDNTLTRIGPETFFSFAAGSRDLTLDRGTLLLQVPKAHGGATIHSAMITASITGTTVIIENLPGKVTKALVLEGSMRVSMNGKFADSVLLTAGQMTIVPPNATRIPAPVTVDLGTVVKTSSLVNMGKSTSDDSELPSAKLINDAVASQEKAKDKSALMPAGYVIHGADFKEHGSGLDALNDSDRANEHRHEKDHDHGHGHGHGHGH